MRRFNQSRFCTWTKYVSPVWNVEVSLLMHATHKCQHEERALHITAPELSNVFTRYAAVAETQGHL